MKTYFRDALRTGLQAAKKNTIPALTLQVLAVLLIISYYKLPIARSLLDAVGRLNEQWTPWFAVLVTMAFGGGIPLFIEAFQARREGASHKSLLQVLFTLIIWGYSGAVAVWFYQLQANLFGNDQEILTVIKKVLVDQFLYVPFYIAPFFTLVFLWRDVHFSHNAVRDALKKKGFLQRAVPLMISNWAVWIPATSVMYAFPLPLQLVLMNLILVFWSLILSCFTSQ